MNDFSIIRVSLEVSLITLLICGGADVLNEVDEFNFMAAVYRSSIKEINQFSRVLAEF